jgi:broad specificity phosphatase PhoE
LPPVPGIPSSDAGGRRPAEVVLVRHGRTEWSHTGRHTGCTDVPLDEVGRAQAGEIGQRLSGEHFDRVLTSPLARARVTCELAGLGEQAEIVDDLREWDYGEYEGLTTAEIRVGHPHWLVFADGCPGGEDAEAVGARADRVIGLLREMPAGARAALFAHGHLLRVLAARWLGLDPRDGRLLALEAGTISRLGWEHEVAAVTRWNSW